MRLIPFGVSASHPDLAVYAARDKYMSAWSRRVCALPAAWRRAEFDWAIPTVAWLMCADGLYFYTVSAVLAREPDWIITACSDIDERRAKFPDFAAWMDFARGAPVITSEQITWPGVRRLRLVASRQEPARQHELATA